MDVSELAARLASKDEKVRALARKRLLATPSSEAGPALADLLSHPFGSVVRDSLRLLGALAVPSCIPRLEEFIERDGRFELVWLARHALIVAQGEAAPRPADGRTRRDAYGADLVATGILWGLVRTEDREWTARAKVPGVNGVDGVVLVAMPSFHDEFLVTITATEVAVWFGHGSYWKAANEDSMWPAGGYRLLVSDDRSIAEDLAALVAAGFDSEDGGVVIDGLRVGGYVVDAGQRTALSERPMLGSLVRAVDTIRTLGMHAAKDEGSYRSLADLAGYVGAPPDVSSTTVPVPAVELSGRCDAEGFARAAETIRRVRPLIVDFEHVGFIAPAVRDDLAELLTSLEIHTVISAENPYHPVAELGSLAHADLQHALAALKSAVPPLEVIGYWRGGSGNDDYPDPHALVDPAVSAESQREVIERLERGIPVWYCMGYSPCRICSENNGAAELTDGRLVWPEGLAHYVRDHDVVLPEPVVRALLSSPEPGEGKWLAGAIATYLARRMDLWQSATRP